jgi:hypothetical protein
MPGVLSQLPAALVAMIEQGVSIHVASRDGNLRASVMRALGSSLDPVADRITVFVSRSQAAQVLRDVEECGRIAVMFSQPSTHLTLQVKSSRVAVRDAEEADRPLLERYARAMEREIASIGYPTRLARGMLAHRIEDVVAVTLQPEEAFDQTPGANAGAPLKGAA